MKFTIYALVFSITDEVYIGATGHPAKRLEQHQADLASYTHCNYRLQNAWNVDGDNMSMKIIRTSEARYVEDICDAELEAMQETIAEHGREHLLNLVIKSDPESFKAYRLPHRPVD